MPTTVFSASLTADSGNLQGYTLRQIVPITGNAQGMTRVTLNASASSGGCTIDHVSIGVYTGTSANTTTTPTELLFSGKHGATIAQGATAVSDWVLFSGYTSSSSLVVICDFNASATCNVRGLAPAPSGDNIYSTSSSASYNQATFGGSLTPLALDYLSLIETQLPPIPISPAGIDAIIGSSQIDTWPYEFMGALQPYAPVRLNPSILNVPIPRHDVAPGSRHRPRFIYTIT